MDSKKENSQSTLRYPVQSRQCKTCIFRPNLSILRGEELAKIQNYLLTGRTHLCHSADQNNPQAKKINTHACRGAGTLQLEVWHRLGWINEPTDEALVKSLQSLGINWNPDTQISEQKNA
jgi:hypothetical protein